MNNIGEICSTSEVHPKGFGGDRKAPELGREHTLGFCSTLRAEQEAGQVPGLRPSFSSSGNGKTLPLVAGSCECRRTPFPGAEYDLSTKKRAGKRLCFPTLLLCSAGVVADAPSGTLSHALQAFGKGLTETFNALRVWVYSFVRPRRITILFPALRCLRRRWVQGHAPASFFAIITHLSDIYKVKIRICAK